MGRKSLSGPQGPRIVKHPKEHQLASDKYAEEQIRMVFGNNARYSS